MRRIIPFSRMFRPAVVLSALLIGGGLAAFFALGFNLGVDFRSGMVQEVQIASTALSVTWDGTGSATIDSNAAGIFVVHAGAGIATQAYDFLFADYPTVGALAAAMTERLEGLNVALYVPEETSSYWLMRGALGDPMLGEVPHRIHYLDPDAEEISVVDVREMMEEALGQAVVVQAVGQPGDRRFLIRTDTDEGISNAPAEAETLADDVPEGEFVEGEDEFADVDEFAEGEPLVAEEPPVADLFAETGDPVDAGDVIETEAAAPVSITAILESYFGEGRVVVLRSDFVDQRFAGRLTDQIGVLILATLVLVLLYTTIRFRLQYAVGAVLGIIHDGIIVVAFVVITRMEFNTTTIAAILTILGYSTNNTIVVFDRIRENRRLFPEDSFVDILNRSLSETLNRTIITTVSTMLAVMSLFIFTTGAMQDFALALMVGMLSGVYTTTFIVTAFMNFWEKRKVARARLALNKR